jgi:ABC-type antimicrobial peptide transport system permease subunit
MARQRKFAIRLSLGAARGRLVRQLFTECILLSVPGCAAALGIALGLSRILAHFPDALGVPMALDGGVDLRVLAFCIALSALSTVLFGLVPALPATRPPRAAISSSAPPACPAILPQSFPGNGAEFFRILRITIFRPPTIS